MLYALKESTGKPAWKYQLGGYVWTPAVSRGVVYVGSDNLAFVAVNAANGKLRWKTTTPTTATGETVSGNVVYADSDGGVITAMSAATGKAIWTYSAGAEGRSVPTFAKACSMTAVTDEHLELLAIYSSGTRSASALRTFS